MNEESQDKRFWPLLLVGGIAIFGFLNFFDGSNPQPEHAAPSSNTQAQSTFQPFGVVKVSALPRASFADKEDDIYSYIAARTKEEKEAGEAVGEIVSYTYNGQNNTGRHLISIVNRSGASIGRYECKDPCKIIEPQTGERFPAGPSLLITSAFTDAINGHLEPTRQAIFPNLGKDSNVPLPAIMESLPDALRCGWFRQGTEFETPNLAFTDDGKMLLYSHDGISPSIAEIKLVKLLSSSPNFQTYRVILKGGRGGFVELIFNKDAGTLSVETESDSLIRLEPRDCVLSNEP